jgi:hypothetical protein
MAYLYNYVGKPEKTKEKVNYILDNFYKNTPDGLIGNEDCGQMSAWYVLSTLGIYDVCPGDVFWQTNSPYFKSITLHLENDSAKKIRGTKDLDAFNEFAPVETMAYEELVPVPIITADSKSFEGSLHVEITSPVKEGNIFYSINDCELGEVYDPYTEPFEITSTATICAELVIDGEPGNIVSATFFKKPNDYTIDIKSIYNRAYHAGGPDGLIDGIEGSSNWRKGDWQGYQSQDFEAVIDLQKPIDISSISARFLQDSRSWILMPTKVEYYISNDNVNFTLVATVKNGADPKLVDTVIVPFTGEIKTAAARYIKVIAYNYGKLPEWHQGYGGDAFIFIDEITVK